MLTIHPSIPVNPIQFLKLHAQRQPGFTGRLQVTSAYSIAYTVVELETFFITVAIEPQSGMVFEGTSTLEDNDPEMRVFFDTSDFVAYLADLHPEAYPEAHPA
jgi:hypothetical protein